MLLRMLNPLKIQQLPGQLQSLPGTAAAGEVAEKIKGNGGFSI
jgi:hypothetical protein